jgi:hypothetical protein
MEMSSPVSDDARGRQQSSGGDLAEPTPPVAVAHGVVVVRELVVQRWMLLGNVWGSASEKVLLSRQKW